MRKALNCVCLGRVPGKGEQERVRTCPYLEGLQYQIWKKDTQMLLNEGGKFSNRDMKKTTKEENWGRLSEGGDI